MDYVTIDIKGGLGNQLFQLVTAYVYGLDHNKHLQVAKKERSPSVFNSRTTYWDTVFKNIEAIDKRFPINSRYTQPGFAYREIPKFNGNVALDGYFQSYKFFDHRRDDVMRLLYFNKEECQTLINQYKTNKQLVSVHFRRGDYKKLQHYHNVLTLDYYKKAFENFDDVDYLIFCEEEDKATIQSELQVTFPTTQFQFSSNNVADYMQMYMMSLCDHNIIANSSFSWWGAYLNNNSNKKVVAPSKWFEHASLRNQTGDIFMSEWIKI